MWGRKGTLTVLRILSVDTLWQDPEPFCKMIQKEEDDVKFYKITVTIFSFRVPFSDVVASQLHPQIPCCFSFDASKGEV